MKIFYAEQRTSEWFELRKGKITGTGVKKLLGRKDTKENYFYDLLAQSMSTSNAAEDMESDLARGIRLESEAVEVFEKKAKKKVEKVGFIQSDFSRYIGCSPDGLIKKGKKYPEAIEVKCLSSANHVKAWLEGHVPEDYMPQVVQSFIVNEDLKVMHVVFYDPRISVKPYVVIDVLREDVEGLVETYKDIQLEMAKALEEKLLKLVKV